jgi:hypothetical protein
MRCEASNLGSPLMIRCSQVVLLRSSLLRRRRSVGGPAYRAGICHRDQLGHIVHLHRHQPAQSLAGCRGGEDARAAITAPALIGKYS